MNREREVSHQRKRQIPTSFVSRLSYLSPSYSVTGRTPERVSSAFAGFAAHPGNAVVGEKPPLGSHTLPTSIYSDCLTPKLREERSFVGFLPLQPI